MKINRHGRAKVLTQSEIQLIFSDGLDNDRDHTQNIFSFLNFQHIRDRRLLM
ncbi:hypothetical protein [Nostoc sp. NMS7]|uniref:hypothetical protein n=1 Tax=Nostoc sp. NMS7 TaxID=2815391 RepID=UPI0025DED3CA|nr:hypothetical protein [Nostoc sp. NMS7]